MSAAGQTESLRGAHRDLTRSRILDAALDLMRTEDLETLKIADVAAKAGMTERTIYRHFAARDELVTALWPRLQARLGSSGVAVTARDIAETPRWLFPNFDKEEGAVRASAFSRAGRALRDAMNEERQGGVRAAVKEARPDLKEPALTRLCAAIELLGGAHAWAVMKAHWGLDGAESGRAAGEAIEMLLGLAPPPVTGRGAAKENKS
jgi:AcrR family transcriptional regulator